jgi:hypothetical protein
MRDDTDSIEGTSTEGISAADLPVLDQSNRVPYRPSLELLGIGTYVGNRVKRFRDMWVIGGHGLACWLLSMSIW